jgi:hypothetical protein
VPGVPNRLVRAAIWDPVIPYRSGMKDERLAIYRQDPAGRVGLMMTAGLTVQSNPHQLRLPVSTMSILMRPGQKGNP